MTDFKPSVQPVPSKLLTVTSVRKSYSSVVLSDVNLDLRSGEVHALVGENGAGKSTLARIIAGLAPPDAGEMWLHGQPFAPRNKVEAEHRGVRIAMQELNLIGNFTVAESIFINQLPNRGGWIDYRRLNADTRGLLKQIGLGKLDPARLVSALGIGQQQLIEIAAGLSRYCGVLILDEPTAALTDPEIELLFTQIRTLTAKGVGILYISHRLEEIQRIADRVTVLRDGQVVATRPTNEISPEEIVRHMVGRALGQVLQRAKNSAGPVALRVCGLRRGEAVRDVSFELRRGETLGFAGLMGSGRTETMRIIFGADQPDAGQVFLHGMSQPATFRSPHDAVRAGIALLTENRKEQGLLLPLPVRMNISLACLSHFCRAGGWIRLDAERDEARRWMKKLSVRCRSSEQPVRELSGGNQQKVVLAKWLLRDCDILIFDEPTRGIDVGAKFELYELLADLAAKGKAIIVVSSDLKELLALSDRIVVMSTGRVAATFDRGAWTQDQIMAAALSGYAKEK